MIFLWTTIHFLLFPQIANGNGAELKSGCSKLCRDVFKKTLDASICRPALNISPKPKVYKACVTGSKTGFDTACIPSCLGENPRPDSYSLCKKKGFSMQSESYCRSGYEQAFKNAIDIVNVRREEVLFETDQDRALDVSNTVKSNKEPVVNKKVEIESEITSVDNKSIVVDEKEGNNVVKNKQEINSHEVKRRAHNEAENSVKNSPNPSQKEKQLETAKSDVVEKHSRRPIEAKKLATSESNPSSLEKVRSEETKVDVVEKHSQQSANRVEIKAKKGNISTPPPPSIDVLDEKQSTRMGGLNKKHIPQPSPIIIEGTPEVKIKGGETQKPSPMPSPEMPVYPRNKGIDTGSVRGQVDMVPKHDVFAEQKDAIAPEISPPQPPVKTSPTNIYEDLIAKPKDSEMEL